MGAFSQLHARIATSKIWELYRDKHFSSSVFKYSYFELFTFLLEKMGLMKWIFLSILF